MSEYLRSILSQAREKADALEAEPVDNLMLIDQPTASNFESALIIETPSIFEGDPNIEGHSNIEADKSANHAKPSRPASKPNISVVRSASKSKAPSIFESPSNIEAGGVKITSNYMRFDLDIFESIKTMSESETRIYLDLLLKTYGQLPAKNMCFTTNPEIALRTGIGSSSSFATAMKSLERKGFIERIFESHQKNKKSIYRVYLPCELPGAKSKTKVETVG